MSNILRMLSIACKAGRLELGEEPVCAAARAKHARLIVVAKDAAENTYRRVRHLGNATGAVWVSVPQTKSELGACVGRSACAMMAVTDMGIAAAIMKGLAADDPEKYAETAAQTEKKAEKMLQRQREKRQHEKNIRQGRHRVVEKPVEKEENSSVSQKNSRQNGKKQAENPKFGKSFPDKKGGKPAGCGKADGRSFDGKAVYGGKKPYGANRSGGARPYGAGKSYGTGSTKPYGKKKNASRGSAPSKVRRDHEKK